MKETIIKIKQLQDIDNRLASWRGVTAAGPAQIAQAREELDQVEERLASHTAQVAALQKRRRELEDEIKDLDENVKKNQLKQLKVKTNDEYQALLKEAEHMAAKISADEDEVLDIIDKLEKFELKRPDLENELSDQTSLFEQKAQEINQTLDECRRKQDETLAAREVLAANIPLPQLSRFNQVAGARGGQGMAPVAGGICLACRLTVPPQVFNELMRNQTLCVCPNCSRLIYWQDHPDFKDANTEAEGAGQAKTDENAA